MAVNLKEYLKRVYELEVLKYEQNRILSMTNGKLQKLRQTGETPKYQMQKKDSFFTLGLLKALGISILIGLFGGTAVFAFYIYPVLNIGGMWDYIFTVLTPTLICFIPYLIYAILKGVANSKKINKKNQNIVAQNKQIDTKNKIRMSVNSKAASELSVAAGNMRNSIAKTNEILGKYYAANIIFEKYRSLIPVSSFYEYLMSGRATKLEGHEGAYNIYESEVRMNVIISKIDEVLTRLDRIEANQHMLANAIRQTNQTVDRLSGSINNISSAVSNMGNSMENIEASTRLAQYNTEIAAKNSEFLKWYTYLK